jgi:putative transposase
VRQALLFKWRYGDASPRRARWEQLTVAIRQLFAAHRGGDGSSRITDDLREAGWRVSEKTRCEDQAGAAAGRPGEEAAA